MGLRGLLIGSLLLVDDEIMNMDLESTIFVDHETI